MVARPVLHQRRIRRLLEPLVVRAAQTPGAARYRKTFPAVAHLWVLLLHVLLGSPSLRQTHARLRQAVPWWQAWGMPRWVSLSQVARSSTSRDPACVEALYADLLALARRTPSSERQWRQLQRLVVLDHTFLARSARLSPWSQTGGHAAGMRLQTLLELGQTLPSQLVLTSTATNDRRHLVTLDLTPWRGWTILFDLGYYSHRQFARLIDGGVSFITRLQSQAVYSVTAQRRVPIGRTPDGDELLMDATITLGSPHNRTGAVLPGVRLVISRNAQGTVHRFITDRHDLTATEIVMLYRQRWQIELFFRWLKRQLGLLRPLGHSRAALWLTVLITAIVALVMLVLEGERPAGMTRVALLMQVGIELLLALCLTGGGARYDAPG